MMAGHVEAAKYALQKTLTHKPLEKGARLAYRSSGALDRPTLPNIRIESFAPSLSDLTLSSGGNNPSVTTVPNQRNLQQGDAPTATTNVKPQSDQETIKITPDAVLSMLLGTSLGAFIFGNVFADESRFNPYAALLGGTIGFMLGSGLGVSLLRNSKNNGK